jgi:drug/metabolite transporter (DMT)-like permease
MKQIPVQEKENQFLIYLAFAAIYVIWGSTYFFIFLGLETIPPFLLMGLRFVAAGVLLLVILKVQGKLKKPTKEGLVKNAFYGTLLLVGGTGSVMWAEQYVPSGIASIVVCSMPFWFLILDYPKWKENFSSKTSILGLIIGFVGVFMLFDVNISGLSEHFLMGIIVIIAGGISWTLGSLFSRYYPTTLPTLMNVAMQSIIAGIVCLNVSYFTNEMEHFLFTNVNLSSWLSLGYLIVFGILAYIAYVWLITKRPLIQVGTYVYVNPVIAVFLGWMFAKEVISLKQLMALFVVLIGVVLVNWAAYRAKIFNSEN